MAAVLYGISDNVYTFYIGGFLLGIGLAWTSTTIVGYVVRKTCKKNRGTVMGFVLAANGIGGAIAVQVITPILDNPIDPFAYRKAYFLMAAVFLLLFLVLLCFYKEPQTDETQTEQNATKKTRGEVWIGVEFSQTKKKWFFYGACVCIFFTGTVLQGVSSITAAHMTDVGLELSFIAAVSTVSSLCLAAFKFLNGVTYDKTGLRATVVIDCVAAIGCMFCLYFMTNSVLGMVLAFACAVFKSIALPMETVLLPI